MRSLNILGSGLFIACAVCGAAFGQAGNADNVAATWHFAGSADLAKNTNFTNIKTMLTLQSSLEFQDLVLNRFSSWVARSVMSSTNDGTSALLRPLVDDVLANESYWGLGGSGTGPMSFIVAVKLDDAHSKVWQNNLGKVFGGVPGEVSPPGHFGGEQWNLAGGKPLQIIRAHDWTILSDGGDLKALQAQFLSSVEQTGRPGPALDETCLEADLDWTRLVQWMPDAHLPLLPARTKISMTANNQNLLMRGTIHYPQPIAWKFDPWRVPYDMIKNPPLVSFTAGQDLAAFMAPDELLSKLSDNPLNGQFYVWALGQMALQNYAAWPVDNTKDTLQRIASQAPAAFNSDLARLDSGKLVWQPDQNFLVWSDLAPMVTPRLEVAPETNGQYLLASFFPLDLDEPAASDALFQQFVGHTNIVYYDWEGTGRRLDSWRLLAGVLPIFPEKAADAGPVSHGATFTASGPIPSIIIEENWFAGLKPMLMQANTATVVTRTAPDELAVVRKSPLGVTALELVVFSHWLTGTGSTGLMSGLLPPKAKVTGPGMPPPGP